MRIFAHSKRFGLVLDFCSYSTLRRSHYARCDPVKTLSAVPQGRNLSCNCHRRRKNNDSVLRLFYLLPYRLPASATASGARNGLLDDEKN